MENKIRYYQALLADRGQHNEIDLGEKLGLDEQETTELIAQLLAEHRIEFVTYKNCNYRVRKRR